MDVYELAKTMTREEFLNSDCVKDSCPREYSLQEFTGNDCSPVIANCRSCWREAVRNIEFKEDTKTFDTGTVFSNLSKNPNLKYKRLSDGLVISIAGGFYKWDSGHKFLSRDDEWELAKDKEVEFMEAIEAFQNDKNIYSLRNDGTNIVHYSHNGNYLHDLQDDDGNPLTSDEILQRKWFIKA